jgi:hypothetical protein
MAASPSVSDAASCVGTIQTTPCSLAGSARHQGGGLGVRGGAAVVVVERRWVGMDCGYFGVGGLRGGCWNLGRIWVVWNWGGLGGV